MALFLALVALGVTVVERIPALVSSEQALIRHDDELVLQLGCVPERPVQQILEDDPGSQSEPGADPEADFDAGVASGDWYIVKRGDTLSSIALQRLGSASHAADLARLNSLADPDDLSPGDRIRLR